MTDMLQNLNSTPNEDESGFTLLETIIALAIMVVTFASILSVESGSINASAEARQMNIVGMLAKSVMVDLEYKLEGKKFEEVKAEGGEAFKPPFENFRWTSLIKEIEFPNLNVGGSGQSKEGQSASSGGTTDMTETLTGLLTKFLSKSVREVTVTVFWKSGSGERKFALSTYWVDLNHEFVLSE